VVGYLYVEVLMELKKLQMPGEGEPGQLFWCYDFNAEGKGKEAGVYIESLNVLEDLNNPENLELLPDPTMHVIGVMFDRAEAEVAERSLSPSSLSKSRAWREEDEREIHTTRTMGVQNNYDVSADASTLRERLVGNDTSKEKNKNTLASITNKYTKLKGSFDFTAEVSANELPIKPKLQSSMRVEGGSATKLSSQSQANQNKFSLNLSGVRRVSGQAKYAPPTSGREKDNIDLTSLSGTLYSERRRNINTPSSALNKLSARGSRNPNEKKKDDSIRDDSNPSIMSGIKLKGEISSTMSSRLNKK